MDNTPTTTNTPTEPLLCKMGCGFFGSNATGDCCSKCWNQSQKKNSSSTDSSSAKAPSSPQIMTPKPTVNPTATEPMHMESTNITETCASPIMKKKKKKASYKDMMASYTSKRKTDEDVEKEKESTIQRVTGGGAFSKIDKI